MNIRGRRATLDDHALLEKIAAETGLGAPPSRAARVSGGYMHRMYRLETASGRYAVKLLNPEIMKRPGVFDNYRTAERFEGVLQDNGIPVVPALEFGGKKMGCIDGRYFYIFDWVDGRTLGWDEIEKPHCEAMGAILAGIHKIERSDSPFTRDTIEIDWDEYIRLAIDISPDIGEPLRKNRDMLYEIQNEGNLALAKLPLVTSICHGDMDCKNVIWVNSNPRIIDLECLSYGNPYMEMFQLALSWSGHGHYRIIFKLLDAFIQSYRRVSDVFNVDWCVLYSGNFDRLEWLEYNMKRALMIECGSDEERLLGVSQVFYTTEYLVFYRSIKNELIDRLNAMFG